MKKTKSKVATTKKQPKIKEKTVKTDKAQKLAKPIAKAAEKKSAKAPVAAPKVEKVATKANAKITEKVVTAKNVQAGQARVIEPLSWDAIKPKLNLNPAPKITKRDKDETIDVKSYSIKARYTVGDRVMHDEFGKGLVRDIIGDFKIRVAFRDCEKVLVHGINN